MHEASHTSLDGHLYGTTQWKEAVEADGKFSSNYARDNPNREDIAETYLVWFATKYARETFSESDLKDWECFMENRFEVFEEISCQQGLMSPWQEC